MRPRSPARLAFGPVAIETPFSVSAAATETAPRAYDYNFLVSPDRGRDLLLFLFFAFGLKATCVVQVAVALQTIRIQARAMALRNTTAIGLAVYCLGARAGPGRAPDHLHPEYM